MSYSRNFEFRKPPMHGARDGRFAVAPTGDPIPIGAPVVITADLNTLGLQIVSLAPDGTARGNGSGIGIAYFEYGPAAFAGDDPEMVTYSDKDTVPLGRAVQVIRGDATVKVALRNTVAREFLGIRSYPGRVMVAGMGATPTVVVGQFLIPGVGTDADGFWKPSTSATNAWLEVTKVDTQRAEVEARMLF